MSATDVLAMSCEIDPCQFDERWIALVACTASGQEEHILACRTHGAMLKAGQIPCPDCGAPLEFIRFVEMGTTG